MMLSRILLILIIITGLYSCAPTRPAAELPVNEVMPVETRAEKIKMVNAFTITGAMAAKNKQKAWTASVNWTQRSAGNLNLRLSGPLGSGTVLINKSGSLVTYKDGGKTVTSRNADQLLQKQTGILLPVNNLYYWVRGLPAPGASGAKKYDRYNHLIQLSQSGYQIQFLQYTSVNNIDLPSKIVLTGRGVMIKLVIKRWQV